MIERPRRKREHKLTVLNKLSYIHSIAVRMHNRYSGYKMY